MHEFFARIFGLFLSPAGVLVLAALDSSMLFYLPAAIDTAVIVQSARNEEVFWIYPLLAMAGSLIGVAVTFAIGRQIGEKGVERWIPPRRLKRVQKKIGKGGAIAIGVTAVLPPPFPLTPFVLTGGALGLDKKKFFATVAAMRFIRFGVESILAITYGRRILGWLESDTFEYVITGLVVIAVTGTAATIVQVIRKAR
jgi:membrane protein YqaA with SNARE-associated domain